MKLHELISVIASPGRTVPECDIQALERHTQAPLPADYRDFLLKCNGGSLDARFAAFGVFPDSLYGLREDEPFSLWTAIHRETDCVKMGLLPIGDEHSGTIIGIRLRDSDSGDVWTLREGEKRRVSNSFAEFVDALEPAEEYSPDTILYGDGMMHLESNRLDEALRSFQESWRIRAHAGTAFRLDRTLRQLNRRDEAHDWFTQAYQLNRNNSKMGTELARSMFERGLHADADRVLREVLAHNRTFGPALRLLDEVSRSAGRPKTNTESTNEPER